MNDLKTEIAANAARLIAEEGCDYATAKRRAWRELTGGDRAPRALPDNALVESELRRYLQTFAADTQPELLRRRRELALRLMHWLARFDPWLVGAVLNGTATGHSGITLHLFTDNAKDVEYFLIDHGIRYEVDEAEDAMELIGFTVRPGFGAGADAPPDTGGPVEVVLRVLDPRAQRVAPRARAEDPGLHPVAGRGRASAVMLQQLLAAAGAAPA